MLTKESGEKDQAFHDIHSRVGDTNINHMVILSIYQFLIRCYEGKAQGTRVTYTGDPEVACMVKEGRGTGMGWRMLQTVRRAHTTVAGRV